MYIHVAKPTPQDPALLCERFNNLLSVLRDEGGRRMAEEELRQRRVRLTAVPVRVRIILCAQVVTMNVYDVALDFVLLDAFSDLEHPPSTVLAVLQNTWITDGMKKSVCVLCPLSYCDKIPPSPPTRHPHPLLGIVCCCVVTAEGKEKHAYR